MGSEQYSVLVAKTGRFLWHYHPTASINFPGPPPSAKWMQSAFITCSIPPTCPASWHGVYN